MHRNRRWLALLGLLLVAVCTIVPLALASAQDLAAPPPSRSDLWTALGITGVAGAGGTGVFAWWLRGVVDALVKQGLPIAVKVEVSVSEDTRKDLAKIVADHDAVVRLEERTSGLEDQVEDILRRRRAQQPM
jgi:hypothetical protein